MNSLNLFSWQENVMYCVEEGVILLEMQLWLTFLYYRVSNIATHNNDKLKVAKTNSPEQGLEPWTFRLKAWRSTNWATRALLTNPEKRNFKYLFLIYYIFLHVIACKAIIPIH